MVIKNLINRNRLKKFMHVSIDELCMCTNFGGRDLSSFEDTVTLFLFTFVFVYFCFCLLFFCRVDVGVDVTCMHINFHGHGL